MNYIRHLNRIFEIFSKDERLNPTHISMYMALFQMVNAFKFPEKFFIDRGEVMHMAKIGSITTYHKCLRELNEWKYLRYYPSQNRFRGSQIHLSNFQTSPKQVVNKSWTSPKQALIHENKHVSKDNKQYKTIIKGKPKNQNETIQFFKEKTWPIIQAKKFFNHYEANGWKMGQRTKIENWKAAAENWMIRFEENKEKFINYLNAKGKLLFGKKFRLYEEDKNLLLKLTAYFVNDHQYCAKLGIDTDKGLLLTGLVGCGKTTLMKLLPHLVPHKRNYDYALIPSRNVVFSFNNLGFKIIEDSKNEYSTKMFHRGFWFLKITGAPISFHIRLVFFYFSLFPPFPNIFFGRVIYMDKILLLFLKFFSKGIKFRFPH